MIHIDVIRCNAVSISYIAIDVSPRKFFNQSLDLSSE